MFRFAKIHGFFTAILLVTCSSNLFAQNTFSSEDDLKKKANELFAEARFSEAYPLFSQLLSLYPKEPAYNYKFGTCLLFSSEEKEKAIPYLEFASRRGSADKEVFYYLGKAYHLNYRFNEAINAYNAFAKKASSKELEKYNVKREIEMCNNGKKLLKNITDLSVLDKKELAEADFFRSYDVSDFNGKLIVKPDEFKTPQDKKRGDRTVMFLQQGSGEIYFSSYGENGKSGKDIYVSKKLPSGEWSKPEALGSPVNTAQDEDYPFLHPNGKVLYFCSKGHNSMGGYDIFKSTREDVSDSWSSPVNMDFAINTPDDDFFFISDSADKVGYFSSQRSSPQGQVMVYKIRLERRPVDISIIKGIVKKESTSSESLSAKITVTKIETDDIAGVFNSNDKSGEYLMNLDNGGKFLFTVEAPGFQKLSEIVIIPVQYELKPLKQEIILKKENGKDKLVVNNLFDQEIDDNDYQAALQFIKERSKLDVNTTSEADTASIEPVDTAKPVTTAIVNENKTNVTKDENEETLSNNDMIDMAYQDAKDAQKEANELRKNADKALVLASDKNEEAAKKQQEAEQLSSSSNPEDIQKASDLKNEARQLSNETVAAYNIAKSLEEDAKKKQEEADFAMKYAKDFESAIKSNSNADAIAKLNQQKELLDDKMDENDNKVDVRSQMEQQALEKQQSSDNVLAKYNELQTEIQEMKSESDRLRKEAENTKNKDMAASLKKQADENDNDIQQKQKQADIAKAKSEQLKTEADNLKVQASLATGLMSEIKAAPEATSQDIAAIDKNKLNKQVEDYKTGSQSGNAIASGETKNENNSVQNKIEEVNKTNTEPVKIDYNTKFNNELAEAENIPDEYVKNMAKAKIYNSWSENIAHEKDSLKKAVKKIKSKAEKEEVNRKITYLDALAVDRTKQAETSKQKAEIIKQSETLAQNKDSVQTTTVSENKTQTASVESVNKEYENKLKATESKPDAYERETEKATIYKDWSAALYDVKQNAGKKEKEEIDKQIKENQELASQSETKAQNAMIEAATASTSTKDTGSAKTETLVQPQKSFIEQIAAVENISDNIEKEKKKAEIYTNWNNSLESEKSTLTQQQSSANKKEKKEIAKKIEALDAEQKEKQQLAEQATAKADELQKEKETLASSNSIQNKIDSTVAVKSNTETTSNEIKTSETPLIVSPAEYKKNETELNKYAQLAANDNSDQVVTAGLLSDDARALHTKAEEQRTKASEETNEVAKGAALSLANDYERQAIEKQDKAKAIYLKANYYVKSETVSSSETTSATEVVATNVKNETAAEVKNESVTPVKNETATETKTENTSSPTTNVTASETQPKSDSSAALTSSETNEIKSTPEYQKYSELKVESDNLNKQAKEQYTKADELKKLSDSQLKQSQDIIESTATMTNQNDINAALVKSNEIDKQAYQAQAQSDSVKKLAQNSEAAANAKRTEAELYAQALPKEKYDAILALTKTEEKASAASETASVNTTTETKQPENLSSTATESSAAAEPLTEAFETKTAPVYSSSKPIPIDEKLPEGLVYKIQVGAFRNPIPQDLFKGITPIMGEKTPQGFIRYTAGIFKKFESADKAKNQVRQMGYRDAFVVAFLNGKRIPVDEAKKVTNETAVVSTVASAETKTEETPPKNETVTQPVVVNDVKSTDVKSVEGLFYTVQIGVFSRKVTSAQLFNIQPLNSEVIQNGGLIRYTTGVYSDVNKAVEAKNKIVTIGIKDAFVTAYYNGKKISADEAKKIQAEQGSGVIKEPPPDAPATIPETTQPEIKQPEVKQPETSVPQPEAQPKVEFTPVENTATADTGLVFKVQIGAFKNEVPIEVANKYIRIAKQGIRSSQDENGLTIYTVGAFSTLEEAEKAKQRVIGQGITDAFVIAFNKGIKITIEEAKNLLPK